MNKGRLNWHMSTVLAGMVALASPLLASDPKDPAPLLLEAAQEITYLGFERALPLFENALTLVPEGSPQWQEATFGKATSLHHAMPATARNIDLARQSYELLIAKTPESKFTPRAMMNIGRIYELVDYLGDKPDREKARQWYQKATDTVPGTLIASEAVLRIAATYVQTCEPDQMKTGLAILAKHLEKNPSDTLASAMWQYMGETYLNPLQDYSNSLACYLKADAIGLLEEGREGPTYWRMANLAERTGKNDIAIIYYTKIIQKTPTSGKAYESQLALKRLGAPVPEIRLFRAGDAAPTTAPAAGDKVSATQSPARKGVENP